MSGVKTCTKCGIEKPLTGFSKHPRSADRVAYVCKICVSVYMRSYYKANKAKRDSANLANYYANRERIAAQRKLSRTANPEKHRLQKIKSTYGLSAESYAEMVARQKGRCSICDEAPSKGGLSVDHDHDTGAVRDLLCVRCNTALGKFRDDPRITSAATAYLKRHHKRLAADAAPHDVDPEGSYCAGFFQKVR